MVIYPPESSFHSPEFIFRSIESAFHSVESSFHPTESFFHSPDSSFHPVESSLHPVESFFDSGELIFCSVELCCQKTMLYNANVAYSISFHCFMTFLYLLAYSLRFHSNGQLLELYSPFCLQLINIDSIYCTKIKLLY